MSSSTTIPKILFIGNSLSYFNNGIWTHVKGLCDAARPPIEILTDKAVEPGATLSVLWCRPQPRKRMANGVTVVILQDDLPETTVSNFHESLRLWLQEASAKNVKPYLLMTWSYSRLPRMPQHTINDAHKAAAAEHSVAVIPVGAAFEAFESQSSCNPLRISLRAPDGEHPSTAGTYLMSCCVFEALTSKSVVGNCYRLSGMSDEEAASLQLCAHEAKF